MYFVDPILCTNPIQLGFIYQFQPDFDNLNLQGDVSNNLLNKSVVRTEKLTKKKFGWFHHIA
jgi:hypothetical protein